MDTATINQLEALAQQYLGTPWVDNAAGPDAFDCWTWVHFCLTSIGYALPSNVWMAKPYFVPVPAPGQPGDVLHFWPPDAPREHIGVQLRYPFFSDCNWGTRGVAIHDRTQRPWPRCIKGIWRYKGAPCD